MKYSNLLLCLSGSMLYVCSAQAEVAPYYAYGDVYTRTGSPEYALIEANAQESTGTVSVSGGSEWWCDVPGSCGVAVTSGASGAYGEVLVDPETGSLGARAGSLGYDSYGGTGRAYGYINQVFNVGSDGSLVTGDGVAVDLNMLLEGYIDHDTQYGTVAGLVTLNYYDPAHQYNSSSGPVDYMPVSFFEDAFYTPDYLDSLLANVRFVDYQTTGTENTINFQGSDSADVNVGDTLILEAMIFVVNDVGSVNDLTISWTDALNTMTPSLTTSTMGATLDVYAPAVPVPAAAWLFISGVVGLIGVARRKRA